MSSKRQWNWLNRSSYAQLSAKPAVETLEDRVVLDAHGIVDPAGVEADSAASDDLVIANAQVVDAQVQEAEDNIFETFESEQALKSFLIETAVSRWSGLFGQPAYPWNYPVPYFGFDDALAVPEADGNFSQTNVQVSGVDEGDIVETDGNYLYVLSDNVFSIIDVQNPDSLEVAWQTTWDGSSWPQEIYLDNDRLTVISSQANYYAFDFVGPVEPAIDLAFAPPYFEPEPPQVITTVYDVSIPSDLVLLSETTVDGWLVASRSIDGTIYLTVQNGLDFPSPEILPVEDGEDSDNTNGNGDVVGGVAINELIWPPIDPEIEGKYVYESEVTYRARLEETVLDVLPGFTTSTPAAVVPEEQLLTAPTDIARMVERESHQLLSLVAINARANVPTVDDASTLMSDGATTVYMSQSSAYAVGSVWNEYPATSIVKFSLADSDVELAAAGQVPGHTLDQYSLDEYDGSLRVATTQGWGEDAINHVHVLQQLGETLQVVGTLTGLAPGETIYSVRFMGDRGFVVTFVRIDPLFDLDLSDPTNPQVAGELKIPGFSEFLQPIDESHLFGIGRNADEETGRIGELQVSVFDVTRGEGPSVVDRFSFPGQWNTWTDATYDPHAITFLPERGLLAFPVTNHQHHWNVFEEEFTDEETQLPPFTYGLVVFNVDVNDGLAVSAVIEHPTVLRRSVQIGDNLLAISSHAVTVHPLSELSVETNELIFQEGLVINNPEPTEDQHADQVGEDATWIDLNVGDSWIESGLEHSGDVDVFQFEVGEFDLISLEAFDFWPIDDGTLVELQLDVIDANGETIHTATFGLEPLATDISVEPGGHYFVSIQAADGESTGKYSVNVIPNRINVLNPKEDEHIDEIGADATPLVFDGNYAHIESLIETGGDRDVFQFRVKDHQTLLIESFFFRETADGIAEFEVQVLDDDGALVASNVTSFERPEPFEVDVESDMIYYLSVAAFESDVTGPYFLEVVGEDLVSPIGPVDPGDVIDVELLLEMTHRAEYLHLGEGIANIEGVLSSDGWKVFGFEVSLDGNANISVGGTGLQVIVFDVEGVVHDAIQTDDQALDAEFGNYEFGVPIREGLPYYIAIGTSEVTTDRFYDLNVFFDESVDPGTGETASPEAGLLDRVYTAIHNGVDNMEYDYDGSGELSQADIDVLVREQLRTHYGDADLDGDVDFKDFNIMSTNYGKKGMSWSDGNFDGDDEVGFEDFVWMSTNFGKVGERVS